MNFITVVLCACYLCATPVHAEDDVCTAPVESAAANTGQKSLLQARPLQRRKEAFRPAAPETPLAPHKGSLLALHANLSTRTNNQEQSQLSVYTNTSQEHVKQKGYGMIAPLDHQGFLDVTTMCCPEEMESFFNRLLDTRGYFVCSRPHVQGLVHWFSCQAQMNVQYPIDIIENGNPCKYWAPQGQSCPAISVECQGTWDGPTCGSPPCQGLPPPSPAPPPPCPVPCPDPCPVHCVQTAPPAPPPCPVPCPAPCPAACTPPAPPPPPPAPVPCPVPCPDPCPVSCVQIAPPASAPCPVPCPSPCPAACMPPAPPPPPPPCAAPCPSPCPAPCAVSCCTTTETTTVVTTTLQQAQVCPPCPQCAACPACRVALSAVPATVISRQLSWGSGSANTRNSHQHRRSFTAVNTGFGPQGKRRFLQRKKQLHDRDDHDHADNEGKAQEYEDNDEDGNGQSDKNDEGGQNDDESDNDPSDNDDDEGSTDETHDDNEDSNDFEGDYENENEEHDARNDNRKMHGRRSDRSISFLQRCCSRRRRTEMPPPMPPSPMFPPMPPPASAQVCPPCPTCPLCPPCPVRVPPAPAPPARPAPAPSSLQLSSRRRSGASGSRGSSGKAGRSGALAQRHSHSRGTSHNRAPDTHKRFHSRVRSSPLRHRHGNRDKHGSSQGRRPSHSHSKSDGDSLSDTPKDTGMLPWSHPGGNAPWKSHGGVVILETATGNSDEHSNSEVLNTTTAVTTTATATVTATATTTATDEKSLATTESLPTLMPVIAILLIMLSSDLDFIFSCLAAQACD